MEEFVNIKKMYDMALTIIFSYLQKETQSRALKLGLDGNGYGLVSVNYTS